MRRTLVLLMTVLPSFVLASPAHAVAIRVYGASAIPDSGLLADVIFPGFAAYETALGISPLDTIQYTALGSGDAIITAENASNHIDAIMTGSPTLELPFVTGGFSSERLGRSFFYNDYVLVGPTYDPAGVAANFPHNAVGAFEAIAAEGATYHDVTFVSRADDSGTNVKEQQIWGQASSTRHPGVGTVVTQEAFNGATDTTRAEPATSSTGTLAYPDWYEHNTTSTPPNQGVNLDDTNTCFVSDPPGTCDPAQCALLAYPDGSCYTLVDRATWDEETEFGDTGNLMIVSDMNSAGAPGGASELTNPFHAYILNTSTNKTAAGRLLDYLTSTTFQNSILPLAPDFVQSAYADVLNSTLPTHKTGAGTFSFSAQLLYTPPVEVPIAGMPVNLQSSSSQSGPWTTIDSQTTATTPGS